MGKYDDFDLDLKQIKNRGSDVRPAATRGYICTKVGDSIIETIIRTYRECTENCPSQDCTKDNRPSCRGPLNDGTIQIMC